MWGSGSYLIYPSDYRQRNRNRNGLIVSIPFMSSDPSTSGSDLLDL